MTDICIFSQLLICRCIEEWVSKANRCPVCNTSIVEEEELVRIRMAILEGRDPHSNTRQRCRRTRGDNGTFQLRAHLSPEAVEPQELASERAPVPIQVQ